MGDTVRMFGWSDLRERVYIAMILL